MTVNKTEIKFWGGLRTIGGNIAEINYENDRIVFDFGYVFYHSVFGNYLSEARENRVIDLLKLGAIPPIDGIYQSADLISDVNLDILPRSIEQCKRNTAVFISHLHLDHMGAMDSISEQIPVYLSYESIELYSLLRKTGEESLRERQLKAFHYNEPIKVGQITVTPYQVDHDVYGASSFMIETPDMRLVFTGDLYMHGYHPHWNEKWLNDISQKKIDILLLEGTSFRPGNESIKRLKESDFTQYLLEVLSDCDGLAFLNIYHRNVKRVEAFIQATYQGGRIPVLEPETAYIMSKLCPTLSFKTLKKENHHTTCKWEEEVYGKYSVVTADDINKHPNQYVIQNSYHNRYDLLEYQLTNSIYIHSNGIPFGDFAINYDTLIHFLNHLKIPYKKIDISGHLTKEDAYMMIDRIQPNIVIPWHTMYPELMPIKESEAQFFLPKLKQTYIYKNKQLLEQ